MNTATITLKRHPWSTFSRSDPKKHWVAKADKVDGIVHIRKWLRKIPVVGLRIVAHEIEHLIKADFRSGGDHHDDPERAATTGQKMHDCGRSFSIRPDGQSRGLLGWTHWFRLKHLSPQSRRYARRLIKKGSVEVVYEEGSLLDG